MNLPASLASPWALLPEIIGDISCMRIAIVSSVLLIIATIHSPDTSAASRSHAPKINWRFERSIMQGNSNSPTGRITDPDKDLVSVKVLWGDSAGTDEPQAVTWWHLRRGASAMPSDMYTVNDPCFNYTGERTVHVTARDKAGHVTRRSFTFTVTADPDWPGPEVPVIDVSPGHDGVIEIGIG